MEEILIIGIGGAIGAVLRFIISGMLQSSFSAFPAGTLGVNVTGSFFLGFIMYAAEFGGVFGEKMRVFLTIGILGAFTTMSTFSYESFKLFENGYTLLFLINVFATVLLTLLAVYSGRALAIAIWR